MKLIVNKTCATITNPEYLTSGMVGKTIDIEYSSDFDGLLVTAVFTNGTETIDVINPGSRCVIPWEVLAKPNRKAKVGIYGYKMEDGEKVIAIPTVYACMGIVERGTDPNGDPSAEISPTIAEQLLGMIGDLANLDTEAKNNLVAAINEAFNSGGGGGTNDHRQLTHRDAADSHPMSAVTGLVTALAAKGTYSKPSGGIPKTDLASGVQTSLSKADTALQQHQSLAGYATESYVQNYHDNTKQDVITDLSSIRSGAALGATAVQPEAGKGLFSGNYNDLSNKPTLFSGNYNDLTNKPTIPTVNDAVLTIKQGGVTKGTFSANASSATEINLDAGGGGGAAIFEITVTEQSGSFTYSPTFAEIQAAITAGKVVVVNYNREQYQYYWHRTNLIYFERVFEDDGYIFRRGIYIDSNGTADVDTYQLNIPNEAYIVHIELFNGEYRFEQGGSWSNIIDALYISDKVVVAEVWNGDGDEEQYVYSFGGYGIAPEHGQDLVFSRAEGNKTSYLYVHGDNSISAEVVDLDDYALKSDLNDYRTAAAQDAIDSGFVKLVGTAGQTIQTNVAVPLNVKNNIALQHRAFVGFQTHDDNAIGFIGVDSGKPTFLAADGVTAKALQGETITDAAGYYTTDTVEGALAEIGAELAGINTLVGSGVIV